MSIINIPVIDVNNELPIAAEITISPDEWINTMFSGSPIWKCEKTLEGVAINNYRLRYLPGDSISTLESFIEYEKISNGRIIDGKIEFSCFEDMPLKTIYVKVHLIPK